MKPIVRLPDKEIQLVQELIDENNACWDVAKVTQNFIAPDVVAICSIPIGRFSEDFWAWSQEKSGNFSVRSCYKLLANINQYNDQPSSSGVRASVFWRILWKLEVPPKVRSFWWRVINKFIPCRGILKKKHMEHIAFCKTCGAEEETIFHAFFECTWARIFWEELKKITSIKIPRLHPDSWATDMIEGKMIKEADACILLCGCWAIWTERNAVWHGEGGRSVIDSVRWALEITFDLAQIGKTKKDKPVKAKPQW